MYKYFADYLGGETDTDKSDSKARIIERIKERLKVKPYLTARLKKFTSGKHGYYAEIARYQMWFKSSTGKHIFKEV